MGEYNEEIFTLLRSVLPGDQEIPTRAFELLRGRFLDYVPNKSMQCVYPATPDFAGLSGNVENGIVAAAVDQAFIAFAALTSGRLCNPLTLNTTAIRPIPADGGNFTVDVRLRHLSKSILAMDAKVLNQDNKTAMTCTTTLLVARR